MNEATLTYQLFQAHSITNTIPILLKQHYKWIHVILKHWKHVTKEYQLGKHNLKSVVKYRNSAK